MERKKDIFIACDFGAGSGRVIAGREENGETVLDELFRFENRQIRLGNTLYWDFPTLFQNMKDGIKKAGEKYGDRICSIGVDTWGVDFAFIDKNGDLLSLPVCYRDTRTVGLCEKYFSSHDRYEHYSHNGTQVMEINTLFQLLAMKEKGSLPGKDSGARLLFMPDLFSYFLTGVAKNEYTIASTSELLNAREKNWDKALLNDAGIAEELFCEIVYPGTVLGKIKKDIAEELHVSEEINIVAVAGHDTASAVMTVPNDGKTRAWISSGTWSLLGTTLRKPVLSKEAADNNFTNEGGAYNTVTFLSNITGLWILQQLSKEWNTNDWSYMISEAEKCSADTLIDVDSKMFTAPKSMQKAINDAVGKELSMGETVRTVLESLAKRYSLAIKKLNKMIPENVEEIYIMGGGSQNALLNSLTEKHTGLKVITGPVEATATGNILCQIRSIDNG